MMKKYPTLVTLIIGLGAMVIFHFLAFAPMLRNPFHLEDMSWLVPVIQKNTEHLGFWDAILCLLSPRNGEWAAPFLNLHIFVLLKLFGPSATWLNLSMLLFHELGMVLFLIWLSRWVKSNFYVFMGAVFYLFWLPTFHAQTWIEATQHVSLVFFGWAAVLVYLRLNDQLQANRPISKIWALAMVCLGLMLGLTKISCVLFPMAMALHFLSDPRAKEKNFQPLFFWVYAFCAASLLPQLLLFLNGGSGSIVLSFLSSDTSKLLVQWSGWPVVWQVVILTLGATALAPLFLWVWRRVESRWVIGGGVALAMVFAAFLGSIPYQIPWTLLGLLTVVFYIRKTPFSGWLLALAFLIQTQAWGPLAAGLRLFLAPYFELFHNDDFGGHWGILAAHGNLWPFAFILLALMGAILIGQERRLPKGREWVFLGPILLVPPLFMGSFFGLIPSRYFIYFAFGLLSFLVVFFYYCELGLKLPRLKLALRVVLVVSLAIWAAFSISAIRIRYQRSLIGQTMWGVDHIAVARHLCEKGEKGPFLLLNAPLSPMLATDWKVTRDALSFSQHLNEMSFYRNAYQALTGQWYPDNYFASEGDSQVRNQVDLGPESSFAKSRHRYLKEYLVGNLNANDWQVIFPPKNNIYWGVEVLYPTGLPPAVEPSVMQTFLLGWRLLFKDVQYFGPGSNPAKVVSSP